LFVLVVLVSPNAVKAETANDQMVKQMQALIVQLTQILNQLIAQLQAKLGEQSTAISSIQNTQQQQGTQITQIQQNTTLSSITTPATSLVKSPSFDTTSPSLTYNYASPIWETQAKICWSANESVSSKLEYGTSPNLTSPITASTNASCLLLENLNPETTYYYRITIKDNSNNVSVSDIKNFTTAVVPASLSVGLDPDNLPAHNVPYGNQNTELVKLRFGASQEENIQIDRIGIALDTSVGTGTWCAGELANMHLVADGVEIASSPNADFNTPLIIPAGGFKTISVVADTVGGLGTQCGRKFKVGLYSNNTDQVYWGNDYAGKYNVRAVGAKSKKPIYTNASSYLYGSVITLGS